MNEEYILWRNFKRWLGVYGTQLLDLLLPIADESKTKPSERYLNYETEINKHFNLLAFYRQQVQPDMPLILVSFDDISRGSCFPVWRVSFNTYFQTISPLDCKDNDLGVCNNPESMLLFKENINHALCDMMMRIPLEMPSYSYKGKPWDYPIRYTVTNDVYGGLQGVPKDEISMFETEFTISDNVSTC